MHQSCWPKHARLQLFRTIAINLLKAAIGPCARRSGRRRRTRDLYSSALTSNHIYMTDVSCGGPCGCGHVRIRGARGAHAVFESCLRCHATCSSDSVSDLDVRVITPSALLRNQLPPAHARLQLALQLCTSASASARPRRGSTGLQTCDLICKAHARERGGEETPING